MSTWVLPAGSNEYDGATDGDLLVRAEGDELHVARVVGDATPLGGQPACASLTLPPLANLVLVDDDTDASTPGGVSQ